MLKIFKIGFAAAALMLAPLANARCSSPLSDNLDDILKKVDFIFIGQAEGTYLDGLDDLFASQEKLYELDKLYNDKDLDPSLRADIHKKLLAALHDTLKYTPIATTRFKVMEWILKPDTLPTHHVDIQHHENIYEDGTNRLLLTITYALSFNENQLYFIAGVFPKKTERPYTSLCQLSELFKFRAEDVHHSKISDLRAYISAQNNQNNDDAK